MILSLLILIVSVGLGILIFVFGLLLLLAEASTPRKKEGTPCGKCGSFGTITFARKEETNREKGFGLVLRKENVKKNVKNGGGQNSTEETERTWQEKVPIIRITTRDVYQCRKCGNISYGEPTTSEQEDFYVPPWQGVTERETIKEIVKVNCPHCGLLIPVTSNKCPHCGAPIELR